MKPELAFLVWAVVLTFVQMLIAVMGATLQVGPPALAGNRAARAHHNMLEKPRAVRVVSVVGLALIFSQVL